MSLLPVSLDVKGKPCLIVGEEVHVLRKLKRLAKASANVDALVVNPSELLKEKIRATEGQCLNGEFQAGLVDDYYLVLIASSDETLIKAATERCKLNNIPINVMNSPERSSFSLPYQIDRAPISIAVSSLGVSSAMTRLIQGRINALIPQGLGKLADFFTDIQPNVKAKIRDPQSRRRFWESLTDGAVAERVYQGEIEQAKQLVEKKLSQEDPLATGEVYLIGAGPGDPDLLTFKALRLLQSADVVLYDRLVNEQFLSFCKKDAQKLYVGKAMSNHSVPQSEINQWLIDYAREGKRVARLKGGDPFIFGRGGEEIEGLAEAHIPFQVIPGITAANGCSAYSGIPLTHRDYAQSVRFITGHLKEGELSLDWAGFASNDQTLVFYMGLSNIETICSELIKHGKPADTLVALVEKGTTRKQRVITADLKTMPDTLKASLVDGPALTIVGNVVELHEKLNWFQPE